MHKLSICIVWIVAVSCSLSGCASSGPPLRQPNASVRAWLLVRTPLGSNIADVRRATVHNGWLLRVDQHPLRLFGKLGHYYTFKDFPFATVKFAEWKFDGSDRLKDISVSGIIDE